MLVTSLSAPSAVCASEMPSLALRIAWFMPRICEVIDAGDGEAGGVVLGGVDALAGRQALHGSLEGLIGDPAAVLRAKRSGVGVDNSHSTVPFPLIRGCRVDPSRATNAVTAGSADGL